MKKRLFDVVVTVFAAILWIPLLTLLVLAVIVSSGFPAFYISSRRVAREENIRIWKLRAMVKNADKIANRDTVPVNGIGFLNIDPNSPLYTRVGRVIERFNLTELPQLLHVVRGQMSLVGSRPLPDRVVEVLKQSHPDVEERFRTKAGVAGPTQLVGRSNLSDADRLDLEYRYCRVAESSYSIGLDLSILVGIVLIALGIKREATYGDVVKMLSRYDKSDVTGPAKPRAVPTTVGETPARRRVRGKRQQRKAS